MALDWTDLARRPEFSGIKRLVDSDIVPAFHRLPADKADRSGAPKLVGRSMGCGFGLFIFIFVLSSALLPGNWFGDLLRFTLFVPLFFAAFAIVFWINRKPLLQWLLRAQTRLAVRSRALDQIAEMAGLTYVPCPGGQHPFLDWLARQSWLPDDNKAALDAMPETDGSMAPAVEAARAARIMGRDPVIIGSAKQKATHEDNVLAMLNVEDGFHGERGGIKFDAFEWVESVDDAPDKHHLIIVLKSPRRIQGITELRGRSLPWLVFRDQADMQSVDLGPKAFNDRYRIRASDQVEARTLFDLAVVERFLAMAHDFPFRAVARGQHLVFDFEGDNRFNLLDLKTGTWSDETLRQGLTDLAETLDLVDALAAVFRVKG